MALVRASPLRRRIGSGDELGRDGRGRAKRRVVERREIFARDANRIFLQLLKPASPLAMCASLARRRRE